MGVGNDFDNAISRTPGAIQSVVHQDLTSAGDTYWVQPWPPCTRPGNTMGRPYYYPMAECWNRGWALTLAMSPTKKAPSFTRHLISLRAPGPTITQAPAQISYGSNFFVSTPDGASIATAVLIRTGAVTHFFDQNTRYLPLAFTQASGGLTLSAPAGANFAPPGYYMLFIVNSSGIPSIAPILELQ
jgi:Domain of unknown function (DUF1929)